MTHPHVLCGRKLTPCLPPPCACAVPRPQEREARPADARRTHLRCCCRCSSDTRKKKWRLLLVRKSWRRLLSVRSGMLNSSFSVGEAESWAVRTSPPYVCTGERTHAHTRAHTLPHLPAGS